MEFLPHINKTPPAPLPAADTWRVELFCLARRPSVDHHQWPATRQARLSGTLV